MNLPGNPQNTPTTQTIEIAAAFLLGAIGGMITSGIVGLFIGIAQDT